MGNRINWDAIANVNFDEKHRKATGMLTGKELFARAHDTLRKSQEALERRREVEPLLRNALLQAMVNKSIIRVMQPINNPTESLGGIAKSEDDDGFYNSSPSANVEARAAARFEEVMEVIPVGTELVFKSWDKQLSQWIFKSTAGREYAVYDKNVLIFKGNQMENPGLYGLLFNTSLIDGLGD